MSIDSSTAPDLDQILKQLLRLEGLDLIPRTGYLQRGVRDAESVTEHSWHVAVVAWTLLPFAQPLDDAKVLELALLHDVGELLIGDLPRPAQRLFPPKAKETAEERAVIEVLSGAGERATELADELRRKSSLEARFIHHCDRLQLLLKTATYARRNEGETAHFFEELAAQQNQAQADSDQFEVFDHLRAMLIDGPHAHEVGAPVS